MTNNGKQSAVVDTSSYNYLLYLPPDYASAGNRPLILFLHGAGERGNDLKLLKKIGIPKIVEQTDSFPFIGVSPQCPKGRNWENGRLVRLLEQVIADCNPDLDRIYLTGVSMGGYGTWRLAAHVPEMFAAIAPICGGGNPSDAKKLKNIPVWAFHGAMDYVVPISESQQMVNALLKSGGDARLTVYPDAGHDSWTRTYDNPELFDWFLSHRKTKP